MLARRLTLSLLLVATCMWLFGALAILRFPTGRRPPNHFTWIDEKGSIVPEDYWRGSDGYLYQGCTGDAYLESLVINSRVWTFCTVRQGHPSELAALDVETHTAHLRWRFPAELPYRTPKSVLPGGPESGSFALVYETSSPKDYAVAVPGQYGWVLKPTGLPSSREFSRVFLGADWVDGQIEVAFAHIQNSMLHVPTDPSLPVASIVSFKIDGSTSVRQIERTAICGDCDRIDLAYRRDGVWRFWVSRKKADTNESEKKSTRPLPDVFEVSESGAERQPVVLPDVRYVSDITPPNRLDLAPRHLLRRDGRITKLEPPPNWPKKSFNTDGYRVEGKEIVPAFSYEDVIEKAPSIYTMQSLDGRILKTTDERLSFVLLDPPIGDLTKLGGCSYLRRPIFVAREAGGMWLVSRDGCYLAVTNDFKRLEAPSVFETAYRGPWGWNNEGEPAAVAAVLWILCGLPLVATFVLITRRWFLKSPRLAAWSVPAMATLYILITARALWQLRDFR